MKKNEIVTVVTPTYNRAYILDKCYESLRLQTKKLFIWMIVDDGSADNTEELVKKWKNEGFIDIEYYRKNNGGKASALNLALEKVSTEYFVCLDSDDTLADNAIELALQELEPIIDNDKYCGIIALRNSPSGEVLGGKCIPYGINDSTVVDIKDKYKIRSEFIEIYKTAIVTKYRFPEIPGEKFISPEYLAREINRKYLFKVSQNIYCYCEYQQDGLTKNKVQIIINNPKGYTLIKRQSFELAKGLVSKSRHAIMYIAGSLLSGEKGYIKNSPNKILALIYLPAGWLMFRIRFSKS